MIRVSIDYADACFIAECAAQLLSENRPSTKRSHCLRQGPVEVLRSLWRNGDDSVKRMVAARIHVWLETDRERRFRVYHRIENGGAR